MCGCLIGYVLENMKFSIIRIFLKLYLNLFELDLDIITQHKVG